MAVTVALRSLNAAGPKQTTLIRRAVALLERAVNSEEFIPRVRAAGYRRTEFLNRDGTQITATVDQIVSVLQNGRERDTGNDGEIDLEISLADLRAPSPAWPGVVGQTSTGHQPITTAYWFINGCLQHDDAISPARHFLHEWLHIAGFIHFPDNSARNDPPYLIGEIVQEILNSEGSALVGGQSAEGRAWLDSALDGPPA